MINFIFLTLIFIYIFYRFNGEDIDLNSNNCKQPMLWLHAVGSHEKLKFASDKEYCGVEIDTVLSDSQKLIASYYDTEDLDALNLNDLILSEKIIKYWWIDLKNLKFSNAYKITKIINRLSKKHKEKFFFIESHDFLGLWRFKALSNNVYKVYWLAKGPNKNNNFHLSTPFYYLRSVLANILIDPDFISMFNYQLGNLDYLWAGKRKIFTFTINSHMEYKKASDMGVSVILTDKL